MNAIHDIDALSMAVPYCHVVVPDREMDNLLSRSGTGPRYGTKINTVYGRLFVQVRRLRGRLQIPLNTHGLQPKLQLTLPDSTCPGNRPP